MIYRCFTFGIGSGASTSLVEGLAKAGNGSSEFVKEGERMQPKVSHNILSLLYGVCVQSYAIIDLHIRKFNVHNIYLITGMGRCSEAVGLTTG